VVKLFEILQKPRSKPNCNTIDKFVQPIGIGQVMIKKLKLSEFYVVS